MIHPACKKTGNHNWDWWERQLSDTEGKKIGTLPDGSPCGSVAPKFYYRRECNNMGCDAIEVAESLVAAGASEILDIGGSEILYGLPLRERE